MRDLPVAVIKFAAEECERQRVTSPLKVWHYVEAWHDAMHAYEELLRLGPSIVPPGLSHDFIQRLAARTEREKNKAGEYRGYFAGVHRFDSPPPQEVRARMDKWLEMLDNMTPEEAYKEFEEIHPFRDGNGRVGKIIFNWLKGKLDDPAMPPNFWSNEAAP
jgi:hypothetical protein